MKKVLSILTVIMCLCSCEKQEQSHWLYYSGDELVTVELVAHKLE